jgi:hypothetical protein
MLPRRAGIRPRTGVRTTKSIPDDPGQRSDTEWTRRDARHVNYVKLAKITPGFLPVCLHFDFDCRARCKARCREEP